MSNLSKLIENAIKAASTKKPLRESRGQQIAKRLREDDAYKKFFEIILNALAEGVSFFEKINEFGAENDRMDCKNFPQTPRQETFDAPGMSAGRSS